MGVDQKWPLILLPIAVLLIAVGRWSYAAVAVLSMIFIYRWLMEKHRRF